MGKEIGEVKRGESKHSLFFQGNELLGHVEKVGREVVVLFQEEHIAREVFGGSYPIKHHVQLELERERERGRDKGW